MNPSQVRDGLKTNLQTITGLRVYELIPDTVTPPAAVVGQLDFTFRHRQRAWFRPSAS